MEQFGGRAVPASDLYALGATLIHLLTGTAPADLPQRDLRIQFSDRISLSSSLVAWIEKLTEPALERRFNTARQALVALESNSLLRAKTDNLTNSLPILRFPDAQICRPRDSRVELNKSSIKLEIKIPLRGIRRLSGILMTIGLAVTVCLTLLLPIILGSNWLMLWMIVPFFFAFEDLFGSTQVKFDRIALKLRSTYLAWLTFGTKH